MITTDYLVSCEDEQPMPPLAAHEIYFLFAQTPQQLNLRWLNAHPDLLDFLVAGVVRRPQNLVTHVQRICLCYQKNLSDHLYGALVDLFSVLENHADDFCGRLLDKVLPKLNTSHAFLLNQYLQDKDITALFMVQNSFSVMGKGLLGTTQLITKIVDSVIPNENTQDPLDLARDYIEYSQFEEAEQVLSTAILETPIRRELHLDLLELYQSLQDVAGFVAMQEKLAEQGNPFPELWDELSNYFSKRNMLPLPNK